MIFGWLPKADEASIVEREMADLNATRTGSADRVGAWNWQDDFGAWLAGTNKERVLELATKKANEALEAKLAPSAAANLEALGALSPSYKGVEGKTEAQLKAELARDAARGTAVQQTLANNPEFDITSLGPNATAGAILQAGAKATKADNEREKLRLEGKADDRYKAEVLRLDRADIRQEKRLAQDRALQADSNRMQLQFQYAQLMQNDRNRAQDRQDKALMAILQGVGNLGSAFTI